MPERDALLVRSTEAARLLGITAQTLAKWRMAGRGPRFIRLSPTPQGRCGYRLSDIREWLEARAAASTSEVLRIAGTK